MNDDIKKGAAQMAAGIKAEAKDFAEEAKEKLEKFKDKFDKDADGKIEFQELSDNVVDETKKSLDKLAKMFKDDNLSDKAKSELNEAFEDFRNKIQPALDAAKKEVAEKAEEIRPVIDNLKEKVDEKLPEEVKTEVEDVKQKLEEVKPMAEAKLMEAEIAKEKVKAEIDHVKLVQEKKEEIEK